MYQSVMPNGLIRNKKNTNLFSSHGINRRMRNLDMKMVLTCAFQVKDIQAIMKYAPE